MKKLIILILASFSFIANGAAPKLDNLSSKDVEDIATEMAVNFIHTAVSPAGTLGSLWGFEVGLFGGLTEASTLGDLVNKQDSTLDISKIPHAGVLGIVTVPFGITAEVTLLPEMEASGITIGSQTLAVKWTMTDSVLSFLPLDIALRGHYSNSKLEYAYTINNASTGNNDVNSTVAFESTSMGANISASKTFLFVTPYVGIGQVSSESDVLIEASGSANIFSFTDSQNTNVKESGIQTFAGVELSMLLLNFGVEYSNTLGIGKYTAKLSLGF